MKRLDVLVVVVFVSIGAATVAQDFEGLSVKRVTAAGDSLNLTKLCIQRLWDPLSELLTRILIQFYAKETIFVTITSSAEDQANQLTQSDIVNGFLDDVGEEISVRLEGERTSPGRSLRVHNVFIVDSYKSFQKIFNATTLDYFDFTGYYTILLTNLRRNNEGDIKRILQDCWELYLVNVIIISYDAMNIKEVLVHTYFPYTAKHCGVVKPIIYDSIGEKSLFKEIDFFPDKVGNFYGCSLIAGTLHFLPFMAIVPQLISKSFLYRGFEGILMTNLAKRLNFTIFHKTSDEDWGKLDGENSTGLSGMLFRGEVNFTIGGFGFSMEHQESLSNTMFYYATPLTLLIPPGRPISALEKLFLPLSFTTWMLLSVVFILAIVFIVIGKFITPQTRDFVFGQRNNYPFINLISIFYGGPMMPLPRRNFARFLVMMWILFCLVVNILADPVKICNLLVLLQVGDFFISIPTYGEMYRIVSAEILHEHRFKTLDPNFKGAITITGISAAYLREKYGNKRFHLSKDQICEFYISILLRRHSYLREPFDRELWRYRESGLIDYWVKASLYTKTGNEKVREYLEDSTNHDDPKPLNIAHLRGIFAFYFIYSFIGLVVFLLEMQSRRSRLIRRICDFLN
uniref:Putative ionotropic receptor ligand binding domain-containing protein n=1 Tax=Lutzomyia longipalpis TaxID=7200 RepID=A0A3F2ZDF9_LUTLO